MRSQRNNQMTYLPSLTPPFPRTNYAHSPIPTGFPKTHQSPTRPAHPNTQISSSRNHFWGTFCELMDPSTGSQNASPLPPESPPRQRSTQRTNVLRSCITLPTSYKKFIWKNNLFHNQSTYTTTINKVSTGPTAWQQKGSGTFKCAIMQSVSPCKPTSRASSMSQAKCFFLILTKEDKYKAHYINLWYLLMSNLVIMGRVRWCIHICGNIPIIPTYGYRCHHNSYPKHISDLESTYNDFCR